MAKSAAFARIKKDILAMTASIPPGRVSTYQSLGGHIDVMPRHVAYILANLLEEERVSIPWHRVVAAGGRISLPNETKASAQAAALAREGISLTPKREILYFERLFLSAAELNSGVPMQIRSDR